MTVTSSAYIAEMAQGTHSFKVSVKRGTGVVDVPVTSATFAVGGHRWRIRCYPRGTCERTKTHVGLYLDLVSDGAEVELVQVLYDFRLLDRATGVFTSVFSVKLLSRPSKGPWGNPCIIKRSLLGASYLKDGCIEIECDVTVVRQSLVEDETVEVDQVPPSDMISDLKRLLESEEGADVVFEVKGEVFRAHEIVLAARSPVFKELLYGSTTRIDNEVKSIRIEDVEPDAFKELLHFIYTDSWLDMNDLYGGKDEETVCRLLVGAEKYGMERMKSICVDILRKRLDDKSVMRTLALADKHRCNKVRDACIEFMKRECPAVYIDILEKVA